MMAAMGASLGGRALRIALSREDAKMIKKCKGKKKRRR